MASKATAKPVQIAVNDIASGELETLRELAVSAMQEVVTLTVPLEVHVGIGVNWELAGH